METWGQAPAPNLLLYWIKTKGLGRRWGKSCKNRHSPTRRRESPGSWDDVLMKRSWMLVHGLCAWGDTSTAANVARVLSPTAAACSSSTALELAGWEAELSLWVASSFSGRGKKTLMDHAGDFHLLIRGRWKWWRALHQSSSVRCLCAVMVVQRTVAAPVKTRWLPKEIKLKFPLSRQMQTSVASQSDMVTIPFWVNLVNSVVFHAAWRYPFSLSSQGKDVCLQGDGGAPWFEHGVCYAQVVNRTCQKAGPRSLSLHAWAWLSLRNIWGEAQVSGKLMFFSV